MPNPASLFRKAALDHLSSPEQLDQMLRVGSMRTWIGLLALLGAVIAALIWGFAGKVDTEVTGHGVIVRRGEVQSVVTQAAGKIETLPVAVGQSIQAGTLIATIREPGPADQLEVESSVRSPYSGRVIEVKTQPGSLVEAGQPILSLEAESGGLQALVYVPADQANQVLPGMAVQISPSQLRREEYGYIQGTVIAVTPYPSTQAYLINTFSNAPLVASLMATGPVVELQVAMVPDPGTPSGLRWSSPHGAAVVLTPGTIVASDIVVREQSPASLVVPYTRKKLGLR